MFSLFLYRACKHITISIIPFYYLKVAGLNFTVTLINIGDTDNYTNANSKPELKVTWELGSDIRENQN